MRSPLGRAPCDPVWLAFGRKSANVLLRGLLRGLFDEDSFEDAKLEAPRPTDSTLARKGRDKDKADKPSTVRIKKLKKGSCDSADKLIDWIVSSGPFLSLLFDFSR